MDETSARHVGLYAGAASEPTARAAVEEAGVLVMAGVQVTDLNSGFFTQSIDRDRTIELGAAVASVGPQVFDPISLPQALRVLNDALAALPHAPAAPDTRP